MRIFFLAIFLTALIAASAFCAGAIAQEPSNVQEINLEYIDNITIRYSSENIVLLKNTSDTLVLKEYFNRDDNSLNAIITSSANNLLIRAGRRSPFIGAGFRGRIEIYLPDSNKNISLRTSSGGIESRDNQTGISINMESSSGNITLGSITADNINLNTSSGSINGETINGNTSIRTSSGNIVFGIISGDVNVSTSSGGIRLGSANGTINVRTSSGRVHCSVRENPKDISITTSSGEVTLEIPQNTAFNFYSRTSSGRLRTAFSDRLSSPLTDRDSVQGVIGQNAAENPDRINIVIGTSSGSINVIWAD